MNDCSLMTCIDYNYRKVWDEDRPLSNSVSTMIYAVFSSLSNDEFCGIVLPEDILPHPNWIFADLLNKTTKNRPILNPDYSFESALNIMLKNNALALPLLDNNHKFVGIITQSNLLKKLHSNNKLIVQSFSDENQQLISERNKLETYTNKQRQVYNVIEKLLNMVPSDQDHGPQLLEYCIHSLKEILDCRYAGIEINTVEGKRKYATIGISLGNILKLFKEAGLKIHQSKQIAFEEDPLIINPSKNDRADNHSSNTEPVNTMMYLPFSHESGAYGRIFLIDKIHGGCFTQEDQIIALNFSNFIALTCKNTHLYKKLQNNEKELKHLAYHDPLTDLPNRSVLWDRLAQAITQCKRYKRKLGIIFLDIDDFKLINDNYGHNVGDVILKKIALQLVSSTRETDTVSRIGGDEFVILLPELVELSDAKEVAKKLLSSLTNPIPIKTNKTSHNTKIQLSGSIGISIYPEHGKTADALISNADTAMYQAKFSGKNKFEIFFEKK